MLTCLIWSSKLNLCMNMNRNGSRAIQLVQLNPLFSSRTMLNICKISNAHISNRSKFWILLCEWKKRKLDIDIRTKSNLEEKGTGKEKNQRWFHWRGHFFFLFSFLFLVWFCLFFVVLFGKLEEEMENCFCEFVRWVWMKGFLDFILGV